MSFYQSSISRRLCSATSGVRLGGVCLTRESLPRSVIVSCGYGIALYWPLLRWRPTLSFIITHRASTQYNNRRCCNCEPSIKCRIRHELWLQFVNNKVQGEHRDMSTAQLSGYCWSLLITRCLVNTIIIAISSMKWAPVSGWRPLNNSFRRVYSL